ncbi:hypothetical protein HDV03_000690 [Kappamyces sp. JEL0829]|nr:hypothetical protein HDV03_000690 [Kappamyces sp. JEL0829]KAJ3338417.1 hypothetical protein HDU91_001235 [Kappamyces sp. JEL0680]
MGNGAKAAMKRERNAKDAAGGGKSQKESNAKAMNVICTVCRQAFFTTVRRPALEEHVSNKHSGKDFSACFPNYSG